MTNAQECRSYYRKPRGRAIHLVQASRHNSVGKIEHTLTVERVAAAIERGRCEVTGLPFNLEHGWNPFAPSIDRKDPERGYTDDNVQVVVWAYNAAKGNGTHEDVLRFARAVLATLLQIVLILSCVPAKAQTRPRPDQLVNPQQVRIGVTDTRPVTLVDSRQLGDGRYTDAPAWLTDPADAGKLTVCVVTFYGYSLEAGLLVVGRVPACYSQFGLALLLTDPIWLAWWNAQARP